MELTTINTGVIAYSITDEELKKLSVEYADVPTDLTIKANYEYVRKATSHLRKLRGDVERRRKELKADALDYGRRVDAAAKDITERITAIEEPLAIAKKDFDTAEELAKREAAMAEERRITAFIDRIDRIKALPQECISKSVEEIKDMRAYLEQEKSTLLDWAGEFSESAVAIIAETCAKLHELVTLKEIQENSARLEEERKAKEEEERIEREKKEAIEAAKRNAELAELRRQVAEQQAEIEAVKAKAVAEKEEQEASRKRAEAFKIAEDEEKERQAAKQAAIEIEQQQNSKSVQRRLDIQTPYSDDYRAAGNAMKAVIGDKQITKTLLDAIINGDIPHIQYTGA